MNFFQTILILSTIGGVSSSFPRILRQFYLLLLLLLSPNKTGSIFMKGTDFVFQTTWQFFNLTSKYSNTKLLNRSRGELGKMPWNLVDEYDKFRSCVSYREKGDEEVKTASPIRVRAHEIPPSILHHKLKSVTSSRADQPKVDSWEGENRRNHKQDCTHVLRWEFFCLTGNLPWQVLAATRRKGSSADCNAYCVTGSDKKACIL